MAMQDSSAMIAGMRTDAVVPGTRIPIGPGRSPIYGCPATYTLTPMGHV
ncbi:hypothetical protein KSD_19410 [Ktedonobacter sp. SOSP1-85]|nr:hypothetical protein [Ktedonobacter sp. SOSP1-85]GHO74170.1 hypothetical protein KSD_19410 [Ktedonobacter sp. SOSP1-85]